MHAEEEVHVEDAEDAGRAVGALGIHWFSEWLGSSVVKRLAANSGGGKRAPDYLRLRFLMC